MPNFKFSGFTSSPEQLHLAEEYWRTLFSKVVGESGTRHKWEPWFSQPKDAGGNTVDLGTYRMVFSRVSLKNRLGLSIIQFEPSKEWADIRARMETFGDPDCDEMIDYLTIDCILSDASEEKISEILLCYLSKVWKKGAFEMKIQDENWDYILLS